MRWTRLIGLISSLTNVFAEAWLTTTSQQDFEATSQSHPQPQPQPQPHHHTVGLELCPDICFCNTVSKIVYCSRRGLAFVPDGIPEDTLQMNLNGNQFESGEIRRRNFTRYSSLEHLYLSECSIDAIEVGTFVDLRNLRWLDISNNRIRVIREGTFRGLDLQHLFLNGNRNIALHPGSFDGLVTTGLYLHDCSLDSIAPEVLDPLASDLRYLWLNGNVMERLDRLFEKLFSRLLHLRLGTNPLECGCDAVWLKEFFDKNGEVFKGSLAPSCLTPRKLKGKYFDELSLFDVRCRAPQFTNVDVHFYRKHIQLRCSATGDPTPVLYWITPSGNTTKFSPSATGAGGGSEVTANEALLELHSNDDGMSDGTTTTVLTGMYICIANNEAGNVTLTVKVPWNGAHLSKSRTETGVRQPPDRNGKQTVQSTSVSRLRAPEVVDARSVSTNPYVTVIPSLVTIDSSAEQHLIAASNPNQSDIGGMTGSSGSSSASEEEWLFSVSELMWAIICTHLGTIFVCLPVISFWSYTGRRCRRRRRRRQAKRSAAAAERNYYNSCGGEGGGKGGGRGRGSGPGPGPRCDASASASVQSNSGKTFLQGAAGVIGLPESVYLNGLRQQQFRT